MKKILLQASIFCLFTFKTMAQVNTQDSLALVDLYNSTSGALWTNNSGWLSSAAVSSWEGVYVSNNRVTELVLIDNNLTGMLPSSLGNLQALTTLTFSRNKLSGSIPVALVNTRINYLDLSFNQLSGTIPVELGSLNTLVSLALANNSLTGGLPENIGNLPNIEALDVRNNQLSGKIPASICRADWYRWQDLYLQNNNFTFDGMECIGVNDPIPTEPEYDWRQYAPQRIISINNANPVLSVSAGGTLSKNTYKWFKDNIEVASVTGDSTYAITSVGRYHSIITNTDANQLTLYSDTLDITDIKSLLQRDSLALADLYSKTDGASWAGNWAAGVPINQWAGVTVNNNRVTSLIIHPQSPNGGFVPESFGNLTALIHAEIVYHENSGVALSGALPQSIGNLTQLKTLVIRKDGPNNNIGISGSIPESFGKLAALEFLDLSNNGLTGTLPESISELQALKTVTLNNNQLSGTIPASYASLVNLEAFNLSNNQLNGPIPAFVCSLPQLSELAIAYNKFNFSGLECIATKPSLNITYTNQQIIRINSNNPELSVNAGGTISKNVYNWYKGSELFASNRGNAALQLSEPGAYHVTVTNDDAGLLTLRSDTVTITGIITLLQRDSLALVDLYNKAGGLDWVEQENWLTIGKPISEWQGVTVANNRVSSLKISATGWGTIPESIGTLTGVKILQIGYDNLSGPIPTSIGNLVQLDSLTIFRNNFDAIGGAVSGAIPESIGNLENLKSLDLRGNQFHGSIPASITQLTQLEKLVLSNNNLTGPLPGSIGNLVLLQQLDLSNNLLTGGIPGSIGSLTELVTITLSDNSFSGNIPESISSLTHLKLLDFSFNQLGGTIPAAISNLTALETLKLSANPLVGELPADIGNLVNLKILFLLDCDLGGQLPASMSNMVNLIDLRIPHNNFIGPVPEWICNRTQMVINISNNRFTFDGMECVPFAVVQPRFYEGQAKIPMLNNNPVLSVAAGGTPAYNSFTWYKDGEEYVTNASDSTLTLSEPGTYYVTVRNSRATDLVLTSEEIVITVVESEGTLPLDFVDIKATACVSGTCIEWTTTNEQNTAHFEVETSTDGNNFKKIGNNINSLNTPGIHTYNAVDNHPASGYNYYRIKQVDKDGTYKYSKTVSVNISVSGIIMAAPNPTTGSFMLKGLDKADRISLYNVNGQLLKQWQNINGNKQLSIANLNNGLYIIKIDQQKKQTIIRLLKQ